MTEAAVAKTSPEPGASLKAEPNLLIGGEAHAPENPEIRPFPGLRPFRQDETHLYFGRETHRRELLKRLSATHFVAVIGTSGSGKSSLIRAGLLPDLYAGYLPKVGSDWIVVDMSPGNDPIGRLTAEFNGVGWAVSADDLRTNSSEILNLADRELREGQHLLILADQFEEFFRLRAREDPLEDRDEKASFVRLLLNAGGLIERVDNKSSSRVHVVIAMRSEYLGRASAYAGFPEAIDQGQYLIPRLSREQLRKAIVHPVHVADAEIEEALVQRLLNDLGDDQDQLPILQHALMRTWDLWKAGGGTGALDDTWYEKSGTFENALSNDASDVLDKAKRALGPNGEQVVKRVFQALRETDVNGGQSRHPTTVEELREIVPCDRATLTKALAAFREHSFLRPSFEELPTAAHEPLPDSALIDVSHEALLRRWTTLKVWIEEDDVDRRLYTRLATRAAEEAGSSKPDYFAPPILPVLQKFWGDRQPPRAWAVRHHPGYEQARVFLEASGRHQKHMMHWRMSAVAVVVFLIIGGASWEILSQRTYAARLENQIVIALAANAAANPDTQTRLILGAETLRRAPSLVESQRLLLQTLFTVAKPTGAIPLGSTEPVTEPVEPYHLALSPAGDVAFVAHDSKLAAINLSTKQDIFRVPLEDSRIFPSADGKLLVAIRDSEVASIFDAASGQQLAKIDVPGPFKAYDVSHGSDLAAFAKGDTIYLCRSSENCRNVIAHRVMGHDLEDIEVSLDGKKLVVDGGVTGGQRTLVLYETEPWRQVARRDFPESEDNKLIMSLDDQNVRLCSSTGVALYDAYDVSLDQSNWSFPSPALECLLPPDKVVTRHNDGMVRVWNNAGIQTAQAGPVNDEGALALAGPRLVVAENQLRLWGVNSYGQILVDVPLRPGFYGRGAYTISANVTSRYDVESGAKTELHLRLSDNARNVAISDSLRGGVFVRRNEIVFAEVGPAGDLLEKWKSALPNDQLIVRSWISPDDRFIVVTVRPRPTRALDRRPSGINERTTWVFDARSGMRRDPIPGEGLEFVPGSDRLLVRRGGQLLLWQLSGGEVPIANLGAISRSGAVRYSPDGSLLAVAEDNEGPEERSQSRVTVLEWPSLTIKYQLQHSAQVTSLAFRKDSQALLTVASESATIHEWDMQTGQEVVRLPVPTSRRRRTAPVSAEFTPSGHIAFNDGAGLTVVPNDPSAWIREACARIRRNLSAEEWQRIMGPNVGYSKTCPELP